MCDHNEYSEDLTGVTHIIEEEELLLEPGDIIIASTATDDDIIELIEYLKKERNLSWE